MVSREVEDRIRALKEQNKFCEDYAEEHRLCRRLGVPTTYMIQYHQFEAYREAPNGRVEEFVLSDDELLAILDTIGNFKNYALSDNIRWMSTPLNHRPWNSDDDYMYTFSLVVSHPDDVLLFKLAHSSIFVDCWKL